MNGLNITFGQIPSIQVVGGSNGGRRTNLMRMISSLIQNDNELINIMNQTPGNNESENNSVSETFLNELEEKNVTNEMIDKKKDCPICLDSFRENEKYIQLPCSEDSHCFHNNCIKEWLSRNNTCPLCRTEFNQQRSITRPRPRPILLSALNPPINNDIPDSTDNNIIDDRNEFILNTIDNFLRDISNEIENPTPNPIINSEDSDLQRAIELSLQEIE